MSFERLDDARGSFWSRCSRRLDDAKRWQHKLQRRSSGRCSRRSPTSSRRQKVRSVASSRQSRRPLTIAALQRAARIAGVGAKRRAHATQTSTASTTTSVPIRSSRKSFSSATQNKSFRSARNSVTQASISFVGGGRDRRPLHCGSSSPLAAARGMRITRCSRKCDYSFCFRRP